MRARRCKGGKKHAAARIEKAGSSSSSLVAATSKTRSRSVTVGAEKRRYCYSFCVLLCYLLQIDCVESLDGYLCNGGCDLIAR